MIISQVNDQYVCNNDTSTINVSHKTDKQLTSTVLVEVEDELRALKLFRLVRNDA